MQYEADKSFLIERNSLEIASDCGILETMNIRDIVLPQI